MANHHLPALLVIMDGFGLAPQGADNAVAAASTPFIDSLYEKYPHTTLGASGEDVGLPDGQMGNSEVGHLNIGAGRIVFQELSRINNAIKDGSIKTNEVFTKTMDDVAASGKTLHLMGLMSPGGVHSMESHCEALVSMAAERGVKTIRVHCFMDGRDVDPHSGAGYVADLVDFLAKFPPRPAATPASPRSRVAIGPWTATTAGSASSSPTTPSPRRPMSSPIRLRASRRSTRRTAR